MLFVLVCPSFMYIHKFGERVGITPEMATAENFPNICALSFGRGVYSFETKGPFQNQQYLAAQRQKAVAFLLDGNLNGCCCSSSSSSIFSSSSSLVQQCACSFWIFIIAIFACDTPAVLE